MDNEVSQFYALLLIYLNILTIKMDNEVSQYPVPKTLGAVQ